ncbi:MAG: ribonuclease P protein component, partial [Gammaproteobacteria bacterium]|nr:ribonuclease P protein component [Gammaproteobacteria bacterium]
MSRQGYPRQLRLLTAGDYRRVFETAAFKVHGKGLMALASPNALGHPRLGLIFSKKNVRRAVDRNRLKRIVR